MTQPDVIVVGCGLAGLTTALAAADAGLRVTVLGTPLIGAASRVSAGLLAPSLDGLPAHVLACAVHARDTFPAFIEMLGERTGLAVPLDRAGIIELGSPMELDAALLRMPASTRLDRRELETIEPALAMHDGGVLHPSDGAVDTDSLMSAIELAADRTPAISRSAASVIAINPATSTVATDTGEAFASEWIVLAAGAWVAHLRGLPRAIPVRPLRGQLIRLRGTGLRHVCCGAGGYLVPRDGFVVVGATSEDVGFQPGTSADGHRLLRGSAESLVPALRDAPTVAHWSALRPMTPDGLPILGPDPGAPKLLYACGYSRNGILISPWAGERLAAHMAQSSQSAVVSPFGIERFRD